MTVCDHRYQDRSTIDGQPRITRVRCLVCGHEWFECEEPRPVTNDAWRW